MNTKKKTHKKKLAIMNVFSGSSTYIVTGNDYDFKTWQQYFPKKIKLMSLLSNPTWRPVFKNYNFKEIEENFEYMIKTNSKISILPHPKLVFNCFNQLDLNKIKVVILGQDPYKNIKKTKYSNKLIPEAMGLSFSVPKGVPIPSSLKNIFNNMIKFGHIERKPSSGLLTLWNLQGCLLLNSSLTLEQEISDSHQEYWTKFTDMIITHIGTKLQNVVFLLWGAWALKKKELIDETKHCVLVSSHPSGYSYNNPLKEYPAFCNLDHFGEANKYLIKCGKKPITWRLV